MVSNSKNSLRIPALIVALGLGAAACSGSDAPDTADAADAAEGANQVEGSEEDGADAEPADDAGAPEASEEDSGGVLNEDTFFEATSAAQLEAGSAHIVLSQDDQEMLAADIALDADPANTAFEGSMTNEGMTMQIRQIGGEMYILMDEMTDGKWMIVDGAGEILGDTDFIEQLDPTVQSQRLKDAITDFSAEQGAETIDGVSTTKYVIVLDTEKITGDADYLGGQLTDALGEEITYEMYVGDDDLVRRQVMDVAGTVQQIDYSNWGEEVTIEAPAKDETITKEEMQDSLAG